MRARTRGTVTVCVALALVTASCSGSTITSSPSTSASASASTSASATAAAAGIIPTIKSRGTLYVGFTNEPPFDYVDANGKLTGFEIELIRDCATREGLPEVLGVQNAFDSLLPGLLATRYDIITAGMSWNAKRAQVATPTQATYLINITAYVQKGNPLNIHSLDDMVGKPYKVGITTGTTQFTLVQSKLGASAVTGYEEYQQLWAALASGRIQVAIAAEAAGALYLQSNPSAPFEAANPFSYPSPLKSVWWVRPTGEEDLVALLNTCINAQKTDGTMAKILEQFHLAASDVLPVNASPQQ